MMGEHESLCDVSQILIHPDIQVRIATNDEAVARYADLYAEGEDLPPVRVCKSTKDGKTYLIDGHHRLLAAKAAQMSMIPAAFIGELTLSDMISESIRANCRQGLALSKADRKRAAEMLCKYYPQMTVRAVAERVGLSKSLVAEVLSAWKAQSVTVCALCKASVLRLFAEDSANGWILTHDKGKERWFCCEEHRREFYAKQAEKAEARKLEKDDDAELEADDDAESDLDLESESELESVASKIEESLSWIRVEDAGAFVGETATPERLEEIRMNFARNPASWSVKACPKCGKMPLLSVEFWTGHKDVFRYYLCHSSPECGYCSTTGALTFETMVENWNSTVLSFVGAVPQENSAQIATSEFVLPDENVTVTLTENHRQCPFCGSESVLMEYQGEFSVSCSNSDCTCYPETDKYDSEAEAWENWDSRKDETEFPEKERFFWRKIKAGFRYDDLFLQVLTDPNDGQFYLSVEVCAADGTRKYFTLR